MPILVLTLQLFVHDIPQRHVIIVPIEVVVLDIAYKSIAALNEVGCSFYFLYFRFLWRLFGSSRLIHFPFRDLLGDNDVVVVLVVFILARVVAGRWCAQNFIIASIAVLPSRVCLSIGIRVVICLLLLLFFRLSQSLILPLSCSFTAFIF